MATAAVVSAWLLLLALVPGGPAAAAPSPAGEAGRIVAADRMLDVPYVPQSESLCGGAAAAMVLRYWKSPPVFAEDFAALVTETAGGITLGDLTRAIRDRGWRALPFVGTAVDVQMHLAQGRPVIALIEDRPGRHHYVVTVAWTGGRVVFHDPARGPFRVEDQGQFERDWAATGRTTLLILPEESPGVATIAEREAPDPAVISPACQQSVDHAIALAVAGDLDAADALLSMASASCPAFSGGPRELAGIRFLQRRWAEAAALAEAAVVRDPSDMHAWQLLATARFLDGDADGALAAWNRREEPRIDLTRIDGLDRTRYAVVADLVNLPARSLLTSTEIGRAARRVAALPVAGASRVSYSPGASGEATVDVAVVERPLVPNTPASLVAAGIHAATAREVRFDVASPTGNGEVWTAAARWWTRRPRVAFSLAAPKLGPWSGLWQIDGSWERQTYQLAFPSSEAGAALFESHRRHAGVAFADWASETVRWEMSGALDHWRDRGHQLAMGAALERRLLADRVALRAQGSVWPGLGDAAAFASTTAALAMRSASERDPAWTGQIGVHVVSAGSPLDEWAGAGTGQGRTPLLRAHPLLVDGIIRAGELSRILVHGTLEFQRLVMTRPLAHVSLAAFTDVAKRARTELATSIPLDVDTGGGLRVRAPGAPGVMRLDVARGWRNGNVVVSAAWQASWPGW